MKRKVLGIGLALLTLAVISLPQLADASSIETCPVTLRDEGEFEVALDKNDTYIFKDTSFSIVKGTALIGSGNTANVELVDEQGELMAKVPVDIILIAGQTVADFHQESIETSRPAEILRITILNEQGQTVHVIKKEMNLIYME